MRQSPAGSIGLEPRLGGRAALRITGMEPALSREFGPLYGRFRVRGLEAPDVVGRRRPLVILAEHDPDTANLIWLLADSNGYDVKVTHDGLEASRLVESCQPNLLVLNIRLSLLDGYEVIRSIRQSPDERIRAMPILLMDVHHRPRDVLAAFWAGVDDYLEMPYDIPVMLRCWRRVTAMCRRPSPLTALDNEDVMIQQVALAYLLERRPEGLITGLADFLWQPDPTMYTAVRWALRQLGTHEALSALAAFDSFQPAVS